MQAIKNKEVISDSLIKGECMEGAWKIEDAHNVARGQSTMWSSEWIQNTSAAAEELITLDLEKNLHRTQEKLMLGC